MRDPTGAGDAYLAGLVFGLSRNLPLAVTGRIAALASAYTIEHQGCLVHTFTSTTFTQRYRDAFGEELPVETFGTLVTN